MLNNGPDTVTFGIHEGRAGTWKKVVETSAASPNDIIDEHSAMVVGDTFYRVAGHAIVVLIRDPSHVPN